MAKNAIVGQSGGPTSVINSSLAGVYESCKRRGAGKVYGMMHGVAGPRAGAGLNALLLLCQRDERKIYTAHRNDITEAQRRESRLLSVDKYAGFGVRVRDRPAAVVVAR